MGKYPIGDSISDGSYCRLLTRTVEKCAVARRGPRQLGLRPQPRGGFAARMQLEAGSSSPKPPLRAPAPRPLLEWVSESQRGLWWSPSGDGRNSDYNCGSVQSIRNSDYFGRIQQSEFRLISRNSDYLGSLQQSEFRLISRNSNYFVHVWSHPFQRKSAIILFFYTFTALFCSISKKTDLGSDKNF